MKKKIIIPIGIVALFLVIGFIIFDNNKIVSTITLDINPSVQINLTKNKKVKNVMGLNDDAKDILDDNYKGKSLDDSFEILISNLIEKGYVDNENNLDVILHVDGKITNKMVSEQIEYEFGKKGIHTEIVIIESVIKEDEELAKKYNVSPAKIAYVKSIIQDNDNITLENLVNDSVSELKETKETGKYCDEGYTLEGDFCLKEIKRVSASKGGVCPRNYLEYEGKCYEETGMIDSNEFYCNEEFNLENDKCIREITENAIPKKYSCTSGISKTRVEAGLTSADAGDANDVVCVDYSNATHPVSPCETHDGTEYTMSGGVCYWHRAGILNGSCPGKVLVNGACWDNASNILICEGYRDGKQYSSRSEFCEGSIKYNNPVVSEYKCENQNAKLTGNKCIIEEVEDAHVKWTCQSGYTLVNNDRCINYNKTAQKENGFVCEGKNTRLKGNQCITYEMIEAKHN